MCKSLYSKGVLDGVGMQSHINAQYDGFSGIPAYTAAMQKYASIGCEVQLTELDISTENGKYTAQQQAEKYKAIFEAAMELEQVTAICVWGPNDANTWIGAENTPLLYDSNNQPKLAYTTLTAMIPQSDWGQASGGKTEPNEYGWYFQSSFEGTTDTWQSRGGASVSASTDAAYQGSGALFVQNRESAWNGAYKSLSTGTFQPEQAYSFSANVMYTAGAATDTFYLKLQYTDANGETQYATIAEANAQKGAWVQLANRSFQIPTGATAMQLYVETAETTNDFYVDEVIGAVRDTTILGAGESKTVLPGDVNYDGKMDVRDLLLAKQLFMQKLTDAAAQQAADVDRNGVLDTTDLALLQDYLLAKITKFPTAQTEEPVEEAGPDTAATMYANFRNGATPEFFASDGWSNGSCFDCVWRGSNATFQNNALCLTIDRDDSGTYRYAGAEYRTTDFYHYGYYETSMQAIKNDGVVSSFFTYTGPSDDNPWDEIDIEILGKDTTKVQLNYYTNGVGNHEYMYDLGFDASQGFHRYGFDWQADHITWYVDGKAVYTATSSIPSTPGKIMMNVWPGTGVDSWLNAYNGNTPLTAKYAWVTYNSR